MLQADNLRGINPYSRKVLLGRAAADAQYGSYDIDLPKGTLKLLNPLRLSKESRAELSGIQKEITALQEDESGLDTMDQQIDALRRMIVCVSHNNGLAGDLIAAVGEDLAVLATIANGYSKGTQVGEA